MLSHKQVWDLILASLPGLKKAFRTIRLSHKEFQDQVLVLPLLEKMLRIQSIHSQTRPAPTSMVIWTAGVKVSVTSSMISSLPSPAKVRRPSQISCARTAEEFALASIV